MSWTLLLFGEVPPQPEQPKDWLPCSMGSPAQIRERIDVEFGGQVVWDDKGWGQYADDDCMLQFDVGPEDPVLVVAVQVRGLGAVDTLLKLARANSWYLCNDGCELMSPHLTGNQMQKEFLFSYGTLQLEPVQMATFGRLLNGRRDVLTGFEEASLVIESETVIAISGKAQHTIAKFTGRTSDTISGTVYEVTPEEIESADNYEVAPCERVAAVLQSGTRAWVYID